MPIDDATRTIVSQFLTARLASAEAAVLAASEGADAELIQASAVNFSFAANLLRRWQELQNSEKVSSQAHSGGQILASLRSVSGLNLARTQHLPLLTGSEVDQTAAVVRLVNRIGPANGARLKIRQRDDRLIMRFENWRLPVSFQLAWSRRRPNQWLVKRLTIERLEAWLWRYELMAVGIEPYISLRDIDRFYLTWVVARQLSLDLD